MRIIGALKKEIQDLNQISLLGMFGYFFLRLSYKVIKPKSRMLLAIVSKMSKEGLLNSQQKGNCNIKFLLIFK